MKKLDIYEIFGLGRSGHHAMINWMIKNIIGIECGMNWKLNVLPEQKLFYINEGNRDIHHMKNYIKICEEDYNHLFISYEDCDINYTSLNDELIYNSKISLNNEYIQHYNNHERVIFIRNFFDNLSSRIIKGFHKEFLFQKLWKQQASNILYKNQKHLKYEDWLTNQSIRSQFLLDVINMYEIHNNNVSGFSSSFDNKDYLNRFDENLFSDELKENIYKDTELKELMDGLGYEFKLK